ncbi:membrane-bound alpha-1,6-mannosyltransferase Initiation-specific [Saitoella coloradoensis]
MSSSPRPPFSFRSRSAASILPVSRKDLENEKHWRPTPKLSPRPRKALGKAGIITLLLIICVINLFLMNYGHSHSSSSTQGHGHKGGFRRVLAASELAKPMLGARSGSGVEVRSSLKFRFEGKDIELDPGSVTHDTHIRTLRPGLQTHSYTVDLPLLLSATVPGKLVEEYRKAWLTEGGNPEGREIPHDILQIWIGAPPEDSPSTSHLWQAIHPEASYTLIDDSMVGKILPALGSDVQRLYRLLSDSKLKMQFLRYASLILVGGISADVDVRPIKPFTAWGEDAAIWLPNFPTSARGLVKDNVVAVELAETYGTPLGYHLGQPSFIVGVKDERSSGDAADEDADGSKICFAQWAMGCVPGHPIILEALGDVMEVFYQAEASTEEKQEEGRRLKRLGPETKKHLADALSAEKMSAKVFEYLADLGFDWKEARDLETPLRVGDVLLLPWAAFSKDHHQ